MTNARHQSMAKFRFVAAAVALLGAATSTGCDVGNEPEVCSPPVSQQTLRVVEPSLFITVAEATTQRYACSPDVVDPCGDTTDSCIAERDAEDIGTGATLDFIFDNRSPTTLTIESLAVEDIRCFSPENESQFSTLAPWTDIGRMDGDTSELVQIQFDRIAPGDCDAVFAVESDAANLRQPNGGQTFRIPVRFFGTSDV